MSTARRKFPPESRPEAARLVIATGKPVASVARELGLGEQLFGRWVAQERARLETPGELATADTDKSELKRLRCNNAQLRLGNEFLAKRRSLLASRQQHAGSPIVGGRMTTRHRLALSRAVLSTRKAPRTALIRIAPAAGSKLREICPDRLTVESRAPASWESSGKRRPRTRDPKTGHRLAGKSL